MGDTTTSTIALWDQLATPPRPELWRVQSVAITGKGVKFLDGAPKQPPTPPPAAEEPRRLTTVPTAVGLLGSNPASGLNTPAGGWG